MSKSRRVQCGVMVAIAMMVLPQAVFARHEKGSGDWVAHKTQKLTKKLSLTDEQAQTVKGILEASQAEMQTAHEAMMKRKEQTDQQILAVLNDEQKAKYTQMVENRKKTWSNHGKQRSWQFWRKHGGES